MRANRNCNICNIEYSFDIRQKSKFCSQKCRSTSYRQNKINGTEGHDYVICKICEFKFKEINDDHLSLHDISSSEYDRKYGCCRTSVVTRGNKNTLSSMMSESMSKKLSDSHKIDNYIKKYGYLDGKIKYESMIKRKTYKNGIQYYIDTYGKELGEVKYEEIQLKKAITLANQIKKYGNLIGRKRYNSWKKSHKIKNSLSHYIKLYGDDGVKKWFDKNDKISKSSSIIDPSEISKFKKYISDVCSYTRISLNMNNLILIELRGRKNGYDLDHIVSKVDGFKNGIDPQVIGHISNLRIIKSSENRKKQHRSDIDIQYIVDKFNMDKEYQDIINLKIGSLNVG